MISWDSSIDWWSKYSSTIYSWSGLEKDKTWLQIKPNMSWMQFELEYLVFLGCLVMLQVLPPVESSSWHCLEMIGVARWMISDFLCLVIVHHQWSELELEVYYWEKFPSGVAIMLTLCNFPKAERQSQRQHQNHFESWIYPSTTQRRISLYDIAFFEENIRLVMHNRICF